MAAIIRAALFDMDGLMFDTERLADRVWEQTVPRYGYAFSPDDMALLRGGNLHHEAEALFKAFAKCVQDAVKVTSDKIPSSKGVL